MRTKVIIWSLCLLLLMLPFPAQAEDPYAPYVAYIAENAVPIVALSEQDADYTRFGDYRVILIGEYHGVQKTYDAEFALLTHLAENLGIRHILLEMGYSDGMLLTEYIGGGDEAILRQMMENLEGTSAYTQDTYAFYERLRTYTQTLPEDQKLVLSGVDLQHQLITGAYYLSRLLPDGEPPSDIALSVSRIRAHGTYSPMYLDFLERDLYEHEDAFRGYVGDAACAEFSRALKSMRQGAAYNADDSTAYREACLIENTIEVQEAHPDAQVFGLFGAFHTRLDGRYPTGEPNLARYLNTRYQDTAGRVASIICLYHACEYRDKDESVLPLEEGSAVTAQATLLLPDDIAFLPLDLPGSPFAARGEQSLQTQQYLVIIQNSPAAKTYSD